MTSVYKSKLASFVHKFYQIYWFIARPKSLGVKVIVETSQEKLLMVRLTYHPNTWTFPGGGVNSGEKLEEASSRELKEEVGIYIDSSKFIKIGTINFSHEFKKDTVHVFKVYSEEVTLTVKSNEVTEAKWFNRNNLPNMGPNAKKFLELYDRS